MQCVILEKPSEYMLLMCFLMLFVVLILLYVFFVPKFLYPYIFLFLLSTSLSPFLSIFLNFSLLSNFSLSTYPNRFSDASASLLLRIKVPKSEERTKKERRRNEQKGCRRGGYWGVGGWKGFLKTKWREDGAEEGVVDDEKMITACGCRLGVDFADGAD